MNTISILGIAVILAFYIAYLTKAVLLRRQGIKFQRLGRGEKPLRTWRIEIVIAVLNYLMPVVLVGSILFWNELSFVHYRLPIVGLVAAFVGVVYFVLAVVAMRSSWRAGIDASQNTTLVTRGIYRISRNPAFVGFDLLYTGTSLAFPTIPLIVLTLLSVIMFHLLILEEEKYLAGRFGEAYRVYKKATLRY